MMEAQEIAAGAAAATVVYKTGAVDLTENDTALVLGATSEPYVLTVLSDGLDDSGGTSLIASIGAADATFESARPAVAWLPNRAGGWRGWRIGRRLPAICPDGSSSWQRVC